MILKQVTINKAKKSSLVSGNRPGEKFFITHPRAQSNVYQNMYFSFPNKANKKKPNKQTRRQKKRKTKKETKEQKRISVENLTEYDDIVCEFALCTFNLLDQLVNFSPLLI